jgi:NAD(P)-dependent dehydrogenase (short-subunit alcohol dehydrogenase family)
VDGAFARVRSELGPVAILVTSAGIEAFDPLLEITPQRWNQIIAVNLTGTFSCVQAAVPDMLAAGWGRIVTISSQSAQSGAPNMAHYTASKGGVIALTKALAVDLARQGITVNTIAPSVVDTPMARAATEAGDFPRHRCHRADDPARSGRHSGRHRRRLLVPVLGGGWQLHHRPAPGRERRHVHLKGFPVAGASRRRVTAKGRGPTRRAPAEPRPWR